VAVEAVAAELLHIPLQQMKKQSKLLLMRLHS
jgi:hypothetical protein